VELRHLIQQAVDNLPIGLRTVFLVRHVEGHSTDETARTLGMTGPAVKTRLHRARIALREGLVGCMDD
jgi:RNA polymerase sigma-70 factor (ECF subfamily)